MTEVTKAVIQLGLMKSAPIERWTAQTWSKELLNVYSKEEVLSGIGALASSRNERAPTLNGISNSIADIRKRPASHEVTTSNKYEKPTIQQKEFYVEIMRMIDHCMGLPTSNMRERKFKALAEWGMKKAKEMEMKQSVINEWENTVKSFEKLYA